MSNLLSRVDGWTRLLIALSGLWIVAGSILYFSGVGAMRTVNLRSPEIITDYVAPVWQSVWTHVTLNAEFARLYEVSTIGGNSIEDFQRDGGWTFIDEYRAIGHALLMFLPVAALWIFSAIAMWVKGGFKKSKTKSH